ncbi:Uncharacterised protein [Campylobacter hyointestinalis]|uniref:Uncharacterized protein n=1 Tax=Campylobacter hyointestinalis subsp. hyointestinalis TaxID=91352 RepID=A0A0S4SAZ4_CAMHY|nr:Uncharacterised protein [Campylobacter hyointestinalis subsp. hyointestinalis]CUU77360.1 Uncharacterised protein [Campylobacter hyointestinalis]CUU67954.1 Uncharacterised protein [Campylobacter hyointestinalis subsp. hyointestinalis]CUU74688.1 Uncharacterised protein [Campylobacter hyointestinalis subsp. hyointestinalis]CUU74867.1 Uncharacterised protein [Campylobacter hyointestinalis subsp. hyointestinalis]
MFDTPASNELIMATIFVLILIVAVGIFLVNRFKENR